MKLQTYSTIWEEMAKDGMFGHHPFTVAFEKAVAEGPVMWLFSQQDINTFSLQKRPVDRFPHYSLILSSSTCVVFQEPSGEYSLLKARGEEVLHWKTLLISLLEANATEGSAVVESTPHKTEKSLTCKEQ